MTPELLQLLSRLEANGDVGTLYLGKGEAVQRIFFADAEVHLLDPGHEYRFLPSPMITDGEGFTRSAVDSVLAHAHKTQHRVSAIFAERGLLATEQVGAYQELETMERCLLALERHSNHFFFEAGSVPEEILTLDESDTGAVPLAVFFRETRDRATALKEFERFFPSREEVPVLSDAGLKTRTETRDWTFKQLAELVDGFRNIHSLLNDCIVYPQRTAIAMTEALRNGLLKKTRFPEFEGVTVETIAPREAARWVEQYENAIQTAADDLMLRQRTALLCLRAGDSDRAVFHYNIIGDALEQRGDFTNALQNYREALRWDAHSLIMQEKCVRVLLHFAEEAFRNEQPEEGRRYLEEALAYNTDDIELYIRIVESYGDPETAVQHALPRLLKQMMRSGHDSLAISLFEELVRRAPHLDSVRKQFINYLLDHDEVGRAVEELEHLAGSLLDRGARAEAHQIYEKIQKLAPGSKTPAAARMPRQARPKKAKQRARLSFVGVTFIMLLGAFGGYQAYSLFELRKLNGRVHAMAGVALPTPGDPEHQTHVRSTEELIRKFRSYRRLHFATAWSRYAQDLEDVLANRSQHMSQQLNRAMTDLYELGEDAEVRGKLAEAELIFRRVETSGDGTLWVARAKQRLKALAEYRDGAAELATRMEEAEKVGEYDEAFRCAKALIFNYPRSKEGVKATLPILIDTIPTGSIVNIDGKEVGTTPFLLRLRPFHSATATVELHGYLPEVIVIDNPKKSVHRVMLSPD